MTARQPHHVEVDPGEPSAANVANGGSSGIGNGIAIPHVRNPIGELNECWVQHLRGETGDEVLTRFGRAIFDRDNISQQNETAQEPRFT